MVTRDFVWNPVIDLQISHWHFFKVNEAFAAILLDKRLLEFFRESSTPRELAKTFAPSLAKSICCDLSAIRTHHTIRIDRDSMLTYISDGTRGMIVTIDILELLGRYESMFQDMINHSLRTFGGY